MREDSLHGLGATLHLGDHAGVIGPVEPADVAHLATGVGVEAGRIEHDFAGVARVERRDADAVFDEGEDAGSVDPEGGVAFELGLGKLAIDGACGLLRASLPRGSSTFLFFALGGFKASHVELESGVAGGVDHEVQRHAKGLVEPEGE